MKRKPLNIPPTKIEGRGRWGLVLEIWLLTRTEPVDHWHDHNRLYSHNSGETYRKHEEARRGVTENLRQQ